MAEALSTHLNRVLLSCGFATEAAYAAATAVHALQLFHLANVSARSLRDLQLQKSRKTGTVSMTAATDYALPSDFHAYIADTMRVANNLTPVNIPATPPRWADIKYAGGPSVATLDARFLADRLHIANPQNGVDVLFEYLSNQPITDSTGTTPKALFTADTDLWQWDDHLFFLDVRWRFRKEKEFADWQIDNAEMRAYVNQLRARNAGAQTLVPAPAAQDYTPNEPYANLWV